MSSPRAASKITYANWTDRAKYEEMVALFAPIIGVPFKHFGRDERGIDCGGIVIWGSKKMYNVDIASPEYEYLWYEQQHPNVLLKVFSDVWTRVDVVEPGDTLFFDYSGNGPSHLGVYLGWARFLHAADERSVVVESLHRFGRYVCFAGRIRR